MSYLKYFADTQNESLLRENTSDKRQSIISNFNLTFKVPPINFLVAACKNSLGIEFEYLFDVFYCQLTFLFIKNITVLSFKESSFQKPLC